MPSKESPQIISPQQALKRYVDQFRTARTSRQRALRNEDRWTPKLDKKLTKLTEQTLRFYALFGLSLSATEVSDEIRRVREKTREQKLINRIRQESKSAEAEMHDACGKMRPFLVNLSQSTQEALRTLQSFDHLSRYPSRNSEVITAFVEKLTGSALVEAGFMDEQGPVKMNQFHRSAQEGRDKLAQFFKRIEEWRIRVWLPAPGKTESALDRAVRRQSRAEERRAKVAHHPYLDIKTRSRRAEAACLARQAGYAKLWTEFGQVTDEGRATLRGLRPVLGPDEVERLIQDANQSNILSIDSMFGAIKRAADRVDEFLRGCPEPVHADEKPGVTGRGAAAGIKGRGSSIDDMPPLQASEVIDSKASQDTATTGDGTGDPAQRARRHGFLANMDRHRAIAEIVTRHAPTWRQKSKAWKDVLQSICTDFDKAASVDESGLYEIPESWKQGKTQAFGGAKAKGWSDALELAPRKLVMDQINNSLKMVLKYSSAS